MHAHLTLYEITLLPLSERPVAARIWLERSEALCPTDPRDRVTLPESTRHPLEQILEIPRRDRPIAVRAWLAEQEEQGGQVEEQNAPADAQETFVAEECPNQAADSSPNFPGAFLNISPDINPAPSNPPPRKPICQPAFPSGSVPSRQGAAASAAPLHTPTPNTLIRLLIRAP